MRGDVRADYEEKLQKVEMTLKKSESKNFFAFRRNEEMGAKIYQMQTEIEELDRKHSLEIQIYQERLAALGKPSNLFSFCNSKVSFGIKSVILFL